MRVRRGASSIPEKNDGPKENEEVNTMPRKSHRTSKALALAFVALAVPLGAADAPAPSVEPAAIEALKSMGAYLRGLKAFQVDTVTTDEDVLDDGQKIQYQGSIKALARIPDGLLVEVSNDRYERTWVYDGKSFTLFARRPNVYATIDAPPTIGKLAELLDDKYGFSVPLEDLFLWGSPGWEPAGITSAMDVGPSVVEGVTCEQYAFRQADVDWQVWIQRGDFPLPRRLVITTRTDEARPQHTAVYTWNLAPSFNDAAFAFEPPKDAGKVVLADATK
jgi:hypothetical protein